jgi:uncharacterized protein YebE (UPF0316 family)
MENLLNPELLIGAGVIFGLRVVNMTLDTLRLRMMARGQKPLSFIFGVVETLIYLYTLSAVIQNLDNWVNIAAYSIGFGVGSIVGMALDERMAVGYVHLSVRVCRDRVFGARSGWDGLDAQCECETQECQEGPHVGRRAG